MNYPNSEHPLPPPLGISPGAARAHGCCGGYRAPPAERPAAVVELPEPPPAYRGDGSGGNDERRGDS